MSTGRVLQSFADCLPELTKSLFPGIRVVASDVDGTLTRGGRFPSEVLNAFERLSAAGIKVILITGRSAGWVQALANYLPVAGAVAENGGVFLSRDGEEAPHWLTDTPRGADRAALRAVFARLCASHPELEETEDNAFRCTDWTFRITRRSGEILPLPTLAALRDECRAHGLEFTYSSLHGHIMHLGQDKAAGLQRVLAEIPHLRHRRDEVVTIGDSPNDESLFDPALFPHSVGVANVAEHRDALAHLPRYVTRQAGADGFLELADALVSAAGIR